MCDDRLERDFFGINKYFVLIGTSNGCGTVWLFASCPVHRDLPSTCHPVSEYSVPWLGVHICFKFGGGLTLKEGYAVAQLVEALRYKPEGRGFDSRWCHWNFSLT
jgi:hypothetical protein